jgi:site-specific recombinase XerD
VRGNGSHARHVPLGPHSLPALLTYVDQYRLALGGAPSGKTEEKHLFLTETRYPLTAMTITQLFLRLNEPAGFTDKRISPSLLRETFAIRFLQAGGGRRALQKQLGLDDPMSVKRYQRFCKQLSEEHTCKQSPGHPAPRRMPKPQISSRRRKRPFSGSA